MPLLHCDKCEHEWEGNANSKCDWCGSGGFILDYETSMECCIKSRNELGMDFKQSANIEIYYSKLIK